MRICSFLPSATEIVYGLGLQDDLYGVTHECDYPPGAKDKPHVVRSVFDEGDPPSSGEISRIISERLEQGLGIYDINEWGQPCASYLVVPARSTASSSVTVSPDRRHERQRRSADHRLRIRPCHRAVRQHDCEAVLEASAHPGFASPARRNHAPPRTAFARRSTKPAPALGASPTAARRARHAQPAVESLSPYLLV